MRRTIATLFMLGATATWAVAADPSPGASGGQRAAQYHIGDADEAEEATTPPAKKTKVDALQSVGYFDEVPAKGAVTPASANFAAASVMGPSSSSCAQPMGCTSTCNNANQCCCGDDWFCNSARVEYLMWWTKGRGLPPLVTTDPAGGVLPDGTILFGDEDIGTNIRNGARITISHLLSDDCTSLDARFWGIEDSSQGFFAGSTTGAPLLAIPFFNAALDVEDAFPVSVPGVMTNGSVTILNKNDLIGGDAWLRRTWYEDSCSRVDILGGYMFSRMDDLFYLSSTSTFAGTDVTQTIQDFIRTQNEFHGVQVGVMATRRRSNNLSLEGLAKLAVGNMRQNLQIAGSTTITDGAIVDVTPGGLFAQASNIGTLERDRFTFIPELNLNAVYDVNACWKVMLGYSFVYYSDVILASDQIDRRVNLQQANIDPQLPGAFFAESDFWAQGLSLGAQYQW